MGMRILIIDTETQDEVASYDLSDSDLKVLTVEFCDEPIGKPWHDWLYKAIQGKVRRLTDEICKGALSGGNEYAEPLDDAGKQKLLTELQKAGYILPPPVSNWPIEFKSKLVELAIVKTALQKLAEFEAKTEP